MEIKEAAENLFCKKFEVLKRHQMDDELSNLMIHILLGSKKEEAQQMLAQTVKEQFLCQVIKKRFEDYLGYKIDDATCLFLACVTETPGSAVMYVHYLAYWCKKNTTKEITFELFCEKIFPMGFPSKEDLSALWDMQKIHNIEELKEYKGKAKHTGNLLDDEEANESLVWSNPLKI